MNANTLWLGMGWTMLHFLWIGTVIGALGRDCDARHASGNVRSALRDCAPDSFSPCSGSPGHRLAPGYKHQPGHT